MPLFLPGLERLGSTKLSGAAATTATVTIPARDMLLIYVNVTGYGGGGDIASLRFNGDTGGNYTSKYASSASAATAWTVSAAQTAQTLARLFAVSATTGRSAIVKVVNNTATEKIGAVEGITGLGATGTGPTIQAGGFTWVNTSAQITSLLMVTAGGQNMNANSGFVVFGSPL